MRRRVLACLLCNFATWFVVAEDLHAQTGSAKIELGRKLFSDTTLSADGTKSCASCHVPMTSFAENRQTSVGVFNRLGTRNAPSLENATNSKTFFWDGRRTSLNEAVTDPFFTAFEMGLNNNEELFSRLAANGYAAKFQYAFGPDSELTEAEIADALASFVRSIPKMKSISSGGTPIDAQSVRRGRLVFFGSGQCSSCHQGGSGQTFTDDAFHPSALGLQDIAADLPALTTQAMSLPTQPRAIAAAIGQTPKLSELGRFLVTHTPADLNTFRTPSLLHVARTAPYMHNGTVPTLEKAVDMEVYYRGLATGEPLQVTAAQKADLISFLRTL